ncbi:hypothetical protein Taro_001071 [Colocasia esculenta]|uniref:Uncharacterized protein n=1 Tax=Colocasia esculenta TaxID=4460 RepID=A0A843TI25_COLES|nr:hypothetical protein [Colocasia esculenta]
MNPYDYGIVINKGNHYGLVEINNGIVIGDIKVTVKEGTSEFSKEDKEKLSLNARATNILCCAISRKEFNCVSACSSAKEIWDKITLNHEGTSKVKETKVDILMAKYEKFKIAL